MRALLAGVLAITIVRTGFAQPVSPDAIRLADLERLALERNPTLQQASSAIEAAKSRARQAGTLPNPLVGYAAEEVNGALNGGKHGVFAEQVVPLGGKLGLSRKAFEALTDERSAELDAQRQRLLAAVRRQAYRAAVAAARVSAREELALLVDEAVLVSYQLFNTGAADRPDVLEAEVEA